MRVPSSISLINLFNLGKKLNKSVSKSGPSRNSYKNNNIESILHAVAPVFPMWSHFRCIGVPHQVRALYPEPPSSPDDSVIILSFTDEWNPLNENFHKASPTAFKKSLWQHSQPDQSLEKHCTYFGVSRACSMTCMTRMCWSRGEVQKVGFSVS